MFKLLFWLALAGFLVVNGAAIFSAYYVNSKVQSCFDSVSENMATARAPEVRTRLKQVFKLQYIDADDLPESFYDELQINATAEGLEIFSLYQVSVWPAGRVEAIDELGEYHPDELTGMDVLRDKLRLDFLFEPYAIAVLEHPDE